MFNERVCLSTSPTPMPDTLSFKTLASLSPSSLFGCASSERRGSRAAFSCVVPSDSSGLYASYRLYEGAGTLWLTFVCKEAGQPLSPALIVAPFLQDAVGFKKYKRLYLSLHIGASERMFSWTLHMFS
jgi:hypothetical protein